jgi:tetratricopeptide (TPR) repeat protein
MILSAAYKEMYIQYLIPHTQMNLNQTTGSGAGAAEGLTALFWGLMIIVTVPIVILFIRSILRRVSYLRAKNLMEEMLAEAGKKERSGEFVSAAAIYERLKRPEKAAALYDRGRDFIKAAVVYEQLGRQEKVIEMYEKGGDMEKAAAASMFSGNYVEAARLYRQQGDRIRTAHALELSGNRLAAAREYREAKDYITASALLKEEGMDKEAAEMYGISLTGEEMGPTTLDKFYTYAALLESAGNREKAFAVFRNMADIDGNFRDVQDKLKAMETIAQPAPEAVLEGPLPRTPEEPAPGETTLRSIILSSRMDPRHSLKLWVQVLKALEKKCMEGRFPANLAPENIHIDAGTPVTFSEETSEYFAYAAPETASGTPPDEVSAIYSLGLILYEMLTGDLQTVGVKRPAEVMSDIPEWLDEITMRCINKDRARRYQRIDEIFSDLLSLKGRK